MTTSNHIIVLFDGVCNLCNGSVQFIIRRDTKQIFKFASLQSAYAQDQLVKFGLPPDGFYSIVVLKDDTLYQRSNAVFKILESLGGFWFLLSKLKVIPRPLRDGVYTFIAKNRYRFFGKKDQCMIPTPALRERFIE